MFENVGICFQNVVVFALLVLPGWISKKTGLIGKEQSDGISKVLMYVLIPAMILDVMVGTDINGSLAKNSFDTCIAAGLIYVVSLVLLIGYCRLRRSRIEIRKVLVFCAVFNNTGFIGMPFIRQMLGDQALLLATMCEVINDLVLFTIGVLYLGQDQHERFSVKKLISPVLLAAVVGLVLFIGQIRLPQVVMQAVGYFGDATTPIALFIVGLQFGEMPFRSLFESKEVWETVLWRLVLIPGFCLGMLYLLWPDNVLVNTVMVLMFAMPTASTSCVVVEQYGQDVAFATRCILVSTLFMAVTVPLWYGLITYML